MSDLDIPMPYGLVFRAPEGNTVLEPPYARIGAGVHTLMVVWDNPKALRVTRSTAMAHATRVDIGEIPAGHGRRSIVIPGIGVEVAEAAYFSLIPVGGVEPGVRASVQVITTPLSGGGGSPLWAAVRRALAARRWWP